MQWFAASLRLFYVRLEVFLCLITCVIPTSAFAEKIYFFDWVQMHPDQVAVVAPNEERYSSLLGAALSPERLNQLNQLFEGKEHGTDASTQFLISWLAHRAIERCGALGPGVLANLDSIRIGLGPLDDATASVLEIRKTFLLEKLNRVEKTLQRVNSRLSASLVLRVVPPSVLSQSEPEGELSELGLARERVKFQALRNIDLSFGYRMRATVLSEAILSVGVFSGVWSSSGQGRSSVVPQLFWHTLASGALSFGLLGAMTYSMPQDTDEADVTKPQFKQLLSEALWLDRLLTIRQQITFTALQCLGRGPQVDLELIARAQAVQALSETETERDIKFSELYDSTCPICLDEMEGGQTVVVGKCGHGFHLSCAEEWFKKSQRCPVCSLQLRSWLRTHGQLVSEE